MPLTPWLGTALLLGIIPLFFIDLDRWFGHIPSELQAFAHVAFFGLLALLLMRLPWVRARPFPPRAVQVLLIILLIGIAIELIQPLFGRSAGLRDLRQNLVGAAAAVSLYAPAGSQRRGLAGLAAALLALELAGPGIGLWDRAVARTQFPVLGEFETRFEHRRWSSGVPDDTVARAGARSLRLELEPGRYAGTTLRRSFGDWNGYTHLEMSLYNPDEAILPLTVSIRDREHERRGGAYPDRFNGRYSIAPGWNDLRIPIAEIRAAPAERALDLADLSQMVIFTVDLEHPRRLYLDRVRLSHGGAP
jgi:hypothetical protein